MTRGDAKRGPAETGMNSLRPTYIALGANLPFHDLEGVALLRAALDRMTERGVKVLRVSSFWETPFWPPEQGPQPNYVNAVAEVDPAGRDANALFTVLAEIERLFGRERRVRWAARTLDLDIIDFAGQTMDGEIVTPHPRAHERAFVLAPLAELAPDWRHPTLGETASALLAALPSDQGVAKLS